MMQKRKKRLPEYAKYRDMLEKNQKPEKRLQEAAEQFTAINDTLKEELPKLYTLTRSLIEGCLRQFVSLQAKWQQSWMTNISRIDRALEQPEDLDSLLHDFRAHWEFILEEAGKFSLINGEARSKFNFLSPATTFSGADEASNKRPSTHNSRSAGSVHEHNPLASPDPFLNHQHRLSGSHIGTSPIGNMFPTPAEQYHAGRTRATSAVSSRGPSTPRSSTAPTPPINATHPPRPATAASSRGPDSAIQLPRSSADDTYRSYSRPRSGTNLLSPEPGYYGNMPSSAGPTTGYISPASFFSDSDQQAQRLREEQAAIQAEIDAVQSTRRQQSYSEASRTQSDFARDFYRSNTSESEQRERTRSKVFSSAMPMDERNAPPSPDEEDDPEVMFLAASLFEFNIDPSRTEAGYPYLRYAPGEVRH